MFFCDGLKRAGLEKVVYDLASGMKQKGLKVAVSCVVGGDLEQEFKNAGINVNILSGERADEYKSGRIKSFIMAMKLALLLKIEGIQALNIHGLGAERIGIFAAKLAGVPVKTFVFHSNYPMLDRLNGNKSLMQRLERQLAAVHKCIAVSEKIKISIVDASIVEDNKVSVITNGIDINAFKPVRSRRAVRDELGLKEDDFCLIQVGRFQPPKNQDISVMAMRKVVAIYPRVHLIFAGHGPDFDKTIGLARSYNLLSHIHFLGIRPDVVDLLMASDLFLLPSSWEGLSISLLEAFASALPVIASDVAGIRDVVDIDTSCAKLVKSRDDEGLAMSIISAIEDPSWRDKAGRAAFKIALNHFDLSSTIDKYFELHRSLFEDSKHFRELS